MTDYDKSDWAKGYAAGAKAAAPIAYRKAADAVRRWPFLPERLSYDELCDKIEGMARAIEALATEGGE